MTEQPPSASQEALDLAERIRDWQTAEWVGAKEIDALCAQRVTAETERLWTRVEAEAAALPCPDHYSAEVARTILRRALSAAPASTGEQPDNPVPDEPLDYIGTEPPPAGYVRLGWACPRDEALRCSGCDETDATPDMCGSGHPAYRSQKWVEWAERNRAAPPSPAAVVDYTERAREEAWFAFLAQKYTQQSDARLRSMGLQYMAAETHDLAKECTRHEAAALSAVASEHQAALLTAEARLQYEEGHREPCYYCGKPVNSLAGNPGEWPVALCHADDPGKVKYHHADCVTDRLDEKAALLARLREPEVREALRSAFMGVPNWQARGHWALTNVEVAGDLADAAIARIEELLK